MSDQDQDVLSENANSGTMREQGLEACANVRPLSGIVVHG